MYWDTLNYLPDDILVKVDRAAMAVSLETRVPFLDTRVIEFAWSLSPQVKIRQGKANGYSDKFLKIIYLSLWLIDPRQGLLSP